MSDVIDIENEARDVEIDRFVFIKRDTKESDAYISDFYSEEYRAEDARESYLNKQRSHRASEVKK